MSVTTAVMVDFPPGTFDSGLALTVILPISGTGSSFTMITLVLYPFLPSESVTVKVTVYMPTLL